MVIDASTDPRSTEPLRRAGVQSYCGVLVRRLDGTPFGSLCHWDLVPTRPAPGSLDMLLHAAPLLVASIASRTLAMKVTGALTTRGRLTWCRTHDPGASSPIRLMAEAAFECSYPLAQSSHMDNSRRIFSSHDRVSERYPAIADGRYDRDEALAAIPLTFKRRSFGAVALVFRSRHEFAAADRAFIASLAECAAQAIERAGLLQAERLARQDAEAANRLKDEFLATMSHELRTPLHSVMGWATLLRSTTLDAATSRRAIDAIERNAKHQARLVDDILDVSRIIGGRLRLDIQPTELATVVGLAVDVVRPAAEAKHINLRLALGDAGVIAADAARLQQVVWNLVSNAVKFTPDGGQIDLSVRRTQGNIAITVTDTGMGIAPDFLPHVFDRFRQFDAATTRRQGGLGLGLAIVRHLVELHGGSVMAHSEGSMRGATFTVTLPANFVCEATRVAAPAHRAQGANVAVAPVDLEGLRVLVVVDDEDSRSMLCTALSSCGADVSSSPSAEAGLAQAASIRPDLLVCDIAMPGMDGYALIRRVRTWTDSAGGRIPAIALTGFARGEDVTRALEAGFQEHAAKPVDLGRFTRTVARLAGRTVGTRPV